MSKKKAKARKTKPKPPPAKRGRPRKEKPITSVQLAKRIEFKNPRELKAYSQNAKAHSLDQIELIANSIQKFGFNAPILIDDTNTVVAGHGRLAAALKLKLEMIPVVVLDHMTDDERRAYIIADNKLGEVGVAWSDEMLTRELKDLDLHDFDLEVIGFSEAELEELLPDLEAEADEILARDDKERASETSNETEGTREAPQAETESDDGEESGDSEAERKTETTEIEVQRPPDLIVRQPVPPAIAEVVNTINFPDLERECNERMNAAETSEEREFWNRMKGAIVFAMTHFQVEGEADENV